MFLLKNGADDVKRHRWFRTVDWEAVPQRKLKVQLLSTVTLNATSLNVPYKIADSVTRLFVVDT